MAINPYQQCPCGSGKQFKWCCQSYYSAVEKAEELLEQKQVVAAGEVFLKLTKDHPKVPQVWVYLAEFHYAVQKIEAAEEALQKALEVEPNYAMAHWFRGVIREDEGEVVGALILYRKAIEYFNPEAKERIALSYSRIAELELAQGKPVAGRYALDQAVQALPQSQELRGSLERIFGAESHMPNIARDPYPLRSAPANAPNGWADGSAAAAAGRPLMAITHFEKIASAQPTADVFFNIGLLRAYLGDNRKAIDALNRSIELDEIDVATGTAALVVLLRCAAGMENESDFVTHRLMMQIRDPEPISNLLNSLGEQNRLVGLNADRENGVFNCLVLEQTSKFGVNVGVNVARVAAQLLIHQDQLLLWHSNKEMLDTIAAEFRDVAPLALAEPDQLLGPAEIANPVTEMLAFPTGPGMTPELWQATRGEQFRHDFEETWLNKPLKAIAGLTPLDAAAHPNYRKHLAGMIVFLEQALANFGVKQADGTRLPLYEFNRLRRKLGLLEGAPIDKARIDFDLLSVADLGTLDVAQLTDDQVGEGYRAALRLEAPDLAAKFATQATTRTTIADRYPYYSHLAKQAKETGGDVLEVLTAGEAADAATNDGRHRGAYAIARGKAMASSNVAEAADIFRTAIAATPHDLSLYGPAAETMLGRKAGKDALTFAEQGLVKAREQNNRDAEQQFMELTAAAKKMLG